MPIKKSLSFTSRLQKFDLLFPVRNPAGKNQENKPIVKQQPNFEARMESNTMLATICGARGLYMKNKSSLEAFVTITLQGKGSLRSRAATEAMYTEGDCRWDEVCEFKLSDKFTTVSVAVHSKSKLGSGELIGKCELDIEHAKTLNGQTNWLRLKKKNSDEKYRGEVQLKMDFSYEKPSMSVSSLSLNQIGADAKENGGSGGGGLMSKMKQKIKAAKGGRKQAEDTMSMASAWSVSSQKSTKSQKFFGKLGKTLGLKDKSATIGASGGATGPYPAGTFLTPNDNHLDSSNQLYETCASGGGGAIGGGGSRNSSTFNVFDSMSRPASVNLSQSNNGNPFADAISPTPVARRYGGGVGMSATLPHAMTSPIINPHESFNRNGSIRSMASSGFGSSKQQNNNKTIDPNNANDLLAVIDSLKLELQVKDSRMQDMQQYMDNLITRVMERNPDLLAATAVKEKPKLRFF